MMAQSEVAPSLLFGHDMRSLTCWCNPALFTVCDEPEHGDEQSRASRKSSDPVAGIQSSIVAIELPSMRFKASMAWA